MLPAELAIVVPTFNEVRNVRPLAAAVSRALPQLRWELIFVDDDSPDGTAAEVRRLAQEDPRVRVVHRFRRRGLSSACVEGILASSAPHVAVMDGDGQHDESVLAAMYLRLKQGDVDLVVGSRYAQGGDMGQMSPLRQWMSRLATRLALRLTRTELGDPMSGFFVLGRDTFHGALPRLSNLGFKILLDVLASAPQPLRVAEVPYTFRQRQFGVSKLDSLVLWEYLQLLLDKAVGRLVPVRFLSFGLVGGSGLLVHFFVLTLLFRGFSADFAAAQAAATLVATSSNFYLNNLLTYRDRRLAGWRLFRGWLTFNMVCAAGALANVGVARWLFERDNFWIVSALAGIAVTTVWNYAMSSIFTWGKR